MKRERFGWIPLFLVPCLLAWYICLLSGTKSYAAEQAVDNKKGIVLEVECGYDSYAKFGRNIPFYANVTAAEDFEGLLRIIVPANNGEENYAYEYPVSVEAGTSFVVRGEIPLFTNHTVITFDIITEKKRAVSEQVTLKTSGREVTELYVGVLSENEEAVEAFQGVNVGEYTDSSFPYVKTRAFALTPEHIENIYYGMDCLDIIVLDEAVSMSLTDAQQGALLAWVSEGGSLIAEIGGGQYIFSEERYPLSENEEVRPYLWEQIQHIKKGSVGYFELKVADMGLMEFAVDNNAIPGSLIGHVCSAETITQIIENDHYYKGEQQYETVREFLDTAMGRKLPRISFYVVVILIYLLAVGPGVFYVLRKKDKAGLIGTAVSGVSLVFAAGIYFMGTSTRYQEPIIRYASILTLEGSQLLEETYLDAKAPNSDSYQLSLLPDYSVQPVSRDNHYYYDAVDNETALRDYKIRLYHGKDASIVTMRYSAPFESQYFKLVKESENRDLLGLGADIKYFNETVSGMIYNETQQSFENVMLIIRNNIYVFGELKPGETLDLQNARRLYVYPDTCEQTADAVTGWSAVEYQANAENQEYAVLSEKTKLLAYYLGQMDVMQGTEATLLAFVTAGEGAFQTGNGYPVYGVSLLNKRLIVNSTSADLEYTNLSAYEIINIDEDASYNAAIGSTYSSSIRLQYNLGSREGLKAVRFGDAGVAADDPDYKAFSGEAYFYNPTTLAYERIDLGKKSVWLSDLEKYITERDGKCYLIVQYSSDFADTEQYKEILLPLVSVIRKK